MRLVAINNLIMVVKDHGEYKSEGGIILPEPIASENTGTIDSIGTPDGEYEVGERIAFCDMGGLYIKVDSVEYVVINKEMIIGKL